MASTPEMWAVAEKRALGRRPWIIGWSALVLTSIISAVIFKFEKKLNGTPGMGEVLLCGVLSGVFSVLAYSFGGWKSFRECMHVLLMPVAAMGIALGVIALLGILVALAAGGVTGMLTAVLVPLVYLGGIFFLPFAALLVAALSCAGGALVYVLLRMMRFTTAMERPR